MIITVKQYQTIWDIALQYAGSLEAAMEILEANGKTSTELLNGEELLISKIYSRKIQQFFNSENVDIASSVLPLGDDGYVPPAPGPIECQTLEELLAPVPWSELQSLMTPTQIAGASVPYLVKYENGTIITGDVQPPGVPLLVEVVNPVVPAGIAYFEPNDFHTPLPSFASGDDGWRIANGVFRNIAPTYPSYRQQLNYAAAVPDISLLYPNKYGTTNLDGTHARYTRIGGSVTPWDLVEPIFDVECHLTGRTLRRVNPAFRDWVSGLNLEMANGFYLPSQKEAFAYRSNTSADITIMGIPGFHLSGYNGWTGTTDPANTANAIRLASSWATGSSIKTTTMRPTIYIKLIDL